MAAMSELHRQQTDYLLSLIDPDEAQKQFDDKIGGGLGRRCVWEPELGYALSYTANGPATYRLSGGVWDEIGAWGNSWSPNEAVEEWGVFTRRCHEARDFMLVAVKPMVNREKLLQECAQ